MEISWNEPDIKLNILTNNYKCVLHANFHPVKMIEATTVDQARNIGRVETTITPLGGMLQLFKRKFHRPHDLYSI